MGNFNYFFYQQKFPESLKIVIIAFEKIKEITKKIFKDITVSFQRGEWFKYGKVLFEFHFKLKSILIQMRLPISLLLSR